MSHRYPVMVDLTGRPCLVVGGGAVATRKVIGLLAADAAVTVLAPALAAPLVELVRSGSIIWREGRYASLGRADDGRPWSLVIAATDEPAVNDLVATDAGRTGAWANHAGLPEGGPLAIPATWSSGPVTVAVSTGGVNPGAARWLADVLASAIGPETLVALELADEVWREDGEDGRPGRRPDWRTAVDSGMLDLIREGHLAEAKERLQACLSSSSD